MIRTLLLSVLIIFVCKGCTSIKEIKYEDWPMQNGVMVSGFRVPKNETTIRFEKASCMIFEVSDEYMMRRSIQIPVGKFYPTEVGAYVMCKAGTDKIGWMIDLPLVTHLVCPMRNEIDWSCGVLKLRTE